MGINYIPMNIPIQNVGSFAGTTGTSPWTPVHSLREQASEEMQGESKTARSADSSRHLTNRLMRSTNGRRQLQPMTRQQAVDLKRAIDAVDYFGRSYNRDYSRLDRVLRGLSNCDITRGMRDPNNREITSMNFLHYAAKVGNPEIFEKVLSLYKSQGGDINARDRANGKTPLVWAMEFALRDLPRGGQGDPPATPLMSGMEIMRMLLEAGADPNVTWQLNGAQHCDYPLKLAIQNHAPLSWIKLLLNKGANPKLEQGPERMTSPNSPKGIAASMKKASPSMGAVQVLLNASIGEYGEEAKSLRFADMRKAFVSRMGANLGGDELRLIRYIEQSGSTNRWDSNRPFYGISKLPRSLSYLDGNEEFPSDEITNVEEFPSDVEGRVASSR